SFVPVRFTPTYSTFKGKECGGVAFLITRREDLNAVEVGIALALALQRLWPREFALSKTNTLLQDEATIEAIKADAPLDQITGRWAGSLKRFAHARPRYLLYS